MRRVAILVADGVDGAGAAELHQALLAQGAVPRFVGIKLGQVRTVDGDALDVEISLGTAPSVLWDAAIVPDGKSAADELSLRGHALEFLKDQYRHCRPILVLGAARSLLDAARIPA